jgi:hypothetical protein
VGNRVIEEYAAFIPEQHLGVKVVAAMVAQVHV